MKNTDKFQFYVLDILDDEPRNPSIECHFPLVELRRKKLRNISWGVHIKKKDRYAKYVDVPEEEPSTESEGANVTVCI